MERLLELRLNGGALKRTHARWLNAALVPLALSPLLVFAFFPKVDLASLAARLLHSLLDVRGYSADTWVRLSLILLASLILAGRRRARILLSPGGLEVDVPWWTGLGLGGQLSAGSFRIPWGAIRSVVLEAPTRNPRPSGYRLVISTDGHVYRFSPFDWHSVGGADHRPGFGELWGRNRISHDRLVERSPLVRALEAEGFDVTRRLADSASKSFDLATHRGLVAQLAVFFLFGGYALVDGLMVRRYWPLELMPWEPFAAVALLGGAVMTLLGRGAPPLERMVVWLFAVAGLAASVYPGLLRINALTGSPHTAVYTETGMGRFRASADALPAVDLRGLHIPEFWARYKPGDTRLFVLYRGLPGFYQLDTEPLLDEVRTFYDKRNASH